MPGWGAGRWHGGLALLLSIASGCRPEPPTLQPPETFLAVVDTIDLDDHGDPIAEVSSFAVLDGLGIAIADQAGRAVRLYDERGVFLRALPSGEGPGEVEDPTSVALFHDSTVAVGEAGVPVVEFFAWDGTSLGSASVPPIFAQRLAATPSGELIVQSRDVQSVTYTTLVESDTGWVASRTFYQWDPAIVETPYWASASLDYPVGIGDSVIVFNSLLFDPRWFTASDSGSFGERPEWWMLPPRPEAGAFSGIGGRRALAEWLGEVDVVQGAAASLGVVAVDIGGHRSTVVARLKNLFMTHSLQWRLLDASTGRPIADIASPGRLLAGGSSFSVLLDANETHGWRVLRLRPILR